MTCSQLFFRLATASRCIAEFMGRQEAIGKNGTIRYIMGDNIAGAELDEFIHGHALHGMCERGRGWEFYAVMGKYLELLRDEDDCPFEVDDTALNEFIGAFAHTGAV